MRILSPRGVVALFWNARRVDGSPFAAGYEALLREFGTDYLAVRHENVTDGELESFFGGPFECRVFDNAQVLEALFKEHQRGGNVTIEYGLRVSVSRLGV